MQALVLSGGGNYGAMQAGALEVLLEAGLQPGMVIGSSAGALNAISIAARPSAEGVRQLQAVWRGVRQQDVGRLNLILGLRRLITGQPSLLSNLQLSDFVRRNFPGEVETFGRLRERSGVRAYAMAVCMETGELRAFGDRDEDRLLDGAMASTAVPPYFPPWRVDGRRFLDGSIGSPLPIRTAVEHGASGIVALHLCPRIEELSDRKGFLAPSFYALTAMLRTQAEAEITWAQDRRVDLRVIRLSTPAEVAFWDYSEPGRLIELGREMTRRALANRSLKPSRSLWGSLQRRLDSSRWFRAPRSAW